MAVLFFLFVLLVLFAFVDVWFFVRCIYYALKSNSLSFLRTLYGVGREHHSSEDLLKPVVLHGIVLPSDVDLHLHMNNSKYLREMDFGRIQMYLQSGLRQEASKHRAATLVAAISIRYRKSMKLWERFSLRTKLVHWNDDALYLEQRFIGKAGFTYAIAMVKMVVRSKGGKVSPTEFSKRFVTNEGKVVEPPPPSPELKCWIESIEKSSESLKNEQLSNSMKID